MQRTHWHADSKYFAGAVALHALLGLMLVGFNWQRHEAVIPQLAIHATLVDRNTLNQVARQPAAPSPPPREPEVTDPEADKQKELAQQQEKQQAQERLKQEQVKQEQLKQAQLKQQQVELQQTQEKERQRMAAEAAKQQQEADKKRLTDIQQKQRDAELKRQADADAKSQAAKEAELKAQLAAEEGQASAVNAGAQDKYVELIRQKVMRAWIKPPSAKLGLECNVAVTQAVGGTVLSAQVVSCNGDAAVRQSIENAVLSASPLPTPEDSRVFLRSFILRFKPAE